VATASIVLPIGAAVLPDGSTDNAAPAIQRVKSSAAAPTPYFLQAAFDASTKEQMMWAFRMPADYVSSLAFRVLFKMASATSGNVVVEGRIAAVTDDDAVDVDAKGFGAANSLTISAPGTAGHIQLASLNLTNNDSVAAGDWVVAYLARDAANASDTATGDMEVIGCALQYTT
jgi:hypothetical protein